ncbi:hypothetical protein AX17_003908 [Amanita inopinata Kibby_2008]|nr:hypothetical protein AX17_003908 [Amanita inopinata Kibby_2008]
MHFSTIVVTTALVLAGLNGAVPIMNRDAALDLATRHEGDNAFGLDRHGSLHIRSYNDGVETLFVRGIHVSKLAKERDGRSSSSQHHHNTGSIGSQLPPPPPQASNAFIPHPAYDNVFIYAPPPPPPPTQGPGEHPGGY